MTKAEFMAIKTYKEYDERRGEYGSLDWSDKDIRDHLNKIFPKADKGYDENGAIDEAFFKKQ